VLAKKFRETERKSEDESLKRFKAALKDALFTVITETTAMPRELSSIMRGHMACEIYDPVREEDKELQTGCDSRKEDEGIYKPCCEIATMYSEEKKKWVCDYHGKINFINENPMRPPNVNMFNWSYCEDCHLYYIKYPGRTILDGSLGKNQIDVPLDSLSSSSRPNIGYKCDGCSKNVCLLHFYCCRQCKYAREIGVNETSGRY